MNNNSQYKYTTQMPDQITLIDRIYQVQKAFSLEGNSQGIVFVVRKEQKRYAVKLFKNSQSYEGQIKYLLKVKQYQFIPKLEHFNPSAEIIRQDGQIQYLPVVVMEFCQNGDLFDLIGRLRNLVPHISIGIGICWFQQILQGLKILHQKGILHRDLKIQNILLDANFRIKICDFGLSSSIDHTILQEDEVAGTRGMRPPQSFLYLNQQQKQRYYGPESDIFCCGVILFNMLFFKKLPIEQQERQKLHRYYQKYFAKKQSHQKLAQFWKICGLGQVPKQVESLLRDMLVMDYKQRPKIDEILSRELFSQKYRDEKIKIQLEKIGPK